MEALYSYLATLPFAARLDYYNLSNAERALIRAMCSFTKNGSGNSVFSSLKNCALRAGMSRKTAQRIVQGWVDQRTGKEHKGLKARGILTEIAPPSSVENRATTYRVNWDAFEIHPRMMGSLEKRLQLTLPGIKRPTVPGELEQFQPATAEEASMDAVQKHPLNPVQNNDTYGHRDHSLRSLCPGATDTVTTRVFDFSSGFSSRKTKAVSKSAWESLPKGLRAKLESELRIVYENTVGRNTFGWSPEQFALNAQNLLLLASDRAGIWPHVAEKIALEEYSAVLREEQAKLSRGGDA